MIFSCFLKKDRRREKRMRETKLRLAFNVIEGRKRGGGEDIQVMKPDGALN